MTAQRKVFRIERMRYGPDRRSGAPVADSVPEDAERDGLAERRHNEILSAIERLRPAPHAATDFRVTEKLLDDYKSQLSEARKLKGELDEMYGAISRTKQEIATLHVTGFQGPEVSRVADELDAIVSGTETATETILASAEDIEQLAQTLVSHLKREANQGMVDDILQNVIKIFEACNFQDLTGQRISKVVGTLHFIEERVLRMMEIWGGIESFADVTPNEIEKPGGDAALLNGPALARDQDTASQDDIDALFD